MLNDPKKNKKKLQKIQNLKFHNSLYNFGRDPSYEYAWIFESKSVVHFQTRCRLKFFFSYGPMLTETKKKIGKNPNFEISQFFIQLW